MADKYADDDAGKYVEVGRLRELLKHFDKNCHVSTNSLSNLVIRDAQGNYMMTIDFIVGGSDAEIQ